MDQELHNVLISDQLEFWVHLHDECMRAWKYCCGFCCRRQPTVRVVCCCSKNDPNSQLRVSNLIVLSHKDMQSTYLFPWDLGIGNPRNSTQRSVWHFWTIQFHIHMLIKQGFN